MIEGKFELSDNNSIKIIGTSFDLNSLKNLNDLLQNLIHKNKVKEINITGNFNTNLQLKSIFNKVSKIDETLSFLNSITQAIEKSDIIFISHVNGILRGPALELALSCNFIKAEVGTSLDFTFTNEDLIPFFGTIQRVIKKLGYKKALQIFLTNRKVNFEEATNLNIINNGD